MPTNAASTSRSQVGAKATTSGRAGRRAGRNDTRGEILDAARSLFAERGFAGTSVRAVAQAAKVDVALVPHYFGNKEGLFRAALEIPVDPDAVVARIMAGPAEEAPQRLVATFLDIWDSPETGPAMVSVIRRVVAEQGSTDMVRDFFATTVLRKATAAILEDVAPEEALERFSLVISQLLGVVMLRKIIGLDPMASMPGDRLAVLLAPTVARYLRGDLSLVDPFGPSTG